MTIVLVHGVPETAAVWDLLVEELAARGEDDVRRLSPPGFGAPVPDGFSGTMHGYRDWLIAQLESIGEPVDLLGHDWGGGHVANVAMARPDLLRTWASDVLGVLDREYVWHDLAQQWQTPGVGETAIDALVAAPAPARAEGLVAAGMSGPIAQRVSPGIDAAMGRSILSLYRSAAQPALSEAGANLAAAAARPGLALLAVRDHMVGTDEQIRRAASRAGARVEVLDRGHWWMTHDPAGPADLLIDFWRSHR